MTKGPMPPGDAARARPSEIRSEAGRQAFPQLHAIEQLTARRRLSGLPWRQFFEQLGKEIHLLPPGTADLVMHGRRASDDVPPLGPVDRPFGHARTR